jgi:hypothetical protein
MKLLQKLHYNFHNIMIQIMLSTFFTINLTILHKIQSLLSRRKTETINESRKKRCPNQERLQSCDKDGTRTRVLINQIRSLI